MGQTDYETGNDSLGTTGWGIRRYWWVMVLSTLLLAVVVPTLVSRLPADQYQASAQVGPSTKINLPNLDSLPKTAESLFGNGAVGDAVRETYSPPLPATAAVIPSRVELVAPQDNIVFTVVGRSDDPEKAQELANVAAGAFAEQLNLYGESMGNFSVKHAATVPPEPEATIAPLPATVIGAVAGLLLGLGLVLLLVAWRRPVVDAASAARLAGAPVLGTVRISSAGEVLGGVAPLCHRLLNGTHTTALLVGPSSADRQALATEVRHLLAAGSRGTSSASHRSRESAELVTIVEAPTEAVLAVRPPSSMVVLVVPVGLPAAAVRRAAEPLVDPGSSAVVLVARARAREHRLGRVLERARKRRAAGRDRGTGERGAVTERP